MPPAAGHHAARRCHDPLPDRDAAADADGLRSRASVTVNSPDGRLHLEAAPRRHRKVLAHGCRRRPASSLIHVRMPRRSGRGSTRSPFAPGRRARRCRWSPRRPDARGRPGARAGRAADADAGWGTRPVDDNGDGLPDTLRHGDAVSLNRPLVDGPPGEPRRRRGAAPLPRLMHHAATSSRPTSRWPRAPDRRWSTAGVCCSPAARTSCPRAASAQPCSGFVKGGGRVLRSAPARCRARARSPASPQITQAAAPVDQQVDIFGAQHGPLTPTNGESDHRAHRRARPLRRRRRVHRLQPLPADPAAGGRARVGCRHRRAAHPRSSPSGPVPARSSRSVCPTSARASLTTSTRRSC